MQGDNAKLNSPMLNFSGDMCISFFYHMHGSNIGTLRMILNGTETLFSESGGKGNRWLGAWINISFSGLGMVIDVNS